MRRIVVAVAWLATFVGAIVLVVLGFVGPFDFSDAGFRVVFVGLAFDVLVFASVGAVLSVRRPSNAVGLILTVSALLVSVTFLAFIFGALLTATRGQNDVLAGVVSLIGSLGIDPTLIVTGALLALVFPDGRLPGPRWRWAVLAIGAAVIVGSALVLVRPGPIGESLANNPFGIAGIPWLESSIGESLDTIALISALLLALAAVVVRYRRSRGAEREQLKWFVAAILLVVVFLSLSLADGATQPTAFDMLAVLSLSLPPLAVGSRSCAIGCTRSTGSSAGRSPGRWSRPYSSPASPASSSACRPCSNRSPAAARSQSPARRSSSSPSSSPCGLASSERWIAASIAPDLTRTAPRRLSRRGSGMTSTWPRSKATC